MGNEQSNAKERTKSVKKTERHENGSVNGLSTPDGPEIDVTGKTTVQNDGGPPSLDHLTDTTEYVVIESDSQPAPDVAPVISDIVDAATKTEEVLATVNETKDDVLETVNKTKDDVLETVNEKKDDALETLNEKKDEVLETLNEKKEEVLETISKTEEVVENTIKAEAKKSKEKINLFGKMFKKKAEPPAPQPAPVEVIEEKVAPSEDQTDQKAPEESPPASDEPQTGSSGKEAATIIVIEHREEVEYLRPKTDASTQTERKSEVDRSTQTSEDVEEVVMKTAATEEDFLSESVVVIGEEAVEKISKAEPLDPGIIIEEVVIMEDSVYENIVFKAERVEVTESFAESETAEEVLTSLPTVVAKCVEAVFTTSSGSTDSATLPKPSVHEGTSESAEDMSADAVLIEDEAGILVMEPILGVAFEEPNLTSATKLKPVEEHSSSLMTKVLVNEDPVQEEAAAVAAHVVAPDDIPGTSGQEKLAPVNIEWPSAKYDCCLEDKSIFLATYNGLITIEELPEDTLDSSDEVKPESIVELISMDENVTVSRDVVADVGLEILEEAESSPVTVKEDAEVIPQTAIDALVLELGTITHQEHAGVYGVVQQEEVLIATNFVSLSGEQEASLALPNKPFETMAVEVIEEATEVSSIGAEATLENAEKGTTLQAERIETSKQIPQNFKEQVQENPIQQGLVQENLIPVEVPMEDVDGDMAPPIEVAEECIEQADLNPVVSSEPAEEIASLPVKQPLMKGLMLKLEDTLESVVEAISEKLELNGNIKEPIHEQSVGLQMEESEPCVSVQEERVEVITPVQVLPEVDQDTAHLSVVVPECTVPAEIKLAVPEEPVDDGASQLTQQPKTTGLILKIENILESVVEVTSAKLEVSEKKDKESADEQGCMPKMEKESEFYVSVQKGVVEKCLTPVGELLEDAAEEHAAPFVVPVKCSETPIMFEEAVKYSTNLLEDQLLVHSDNQPESDVEAVSEGNVTESAVGEIVDDQDPVPMTDAKEELEPSVSVQEPLVEKVLTPMHMLMQDSQVTACPPISALESIVPTEKNPLIPEEPVEDSASLLTQQPKTTLESAGQAILVNLKVTEDICEEPTGNEDNVQGMQVGEKSELCVSVQGEFREENITEVGELLEDTYEENAAAFVVAVKCYETIPIVSEELVVDSKSLHEDQQKTKVLMVQSESLQEADVEAISEKTEVTESTVGEPEDNQDCMLKTDAKEESEPCGSVQEKLPENVTTVEALLEEASEETVAPTLVSFECIKPIRTNIAYSVPVQRPLAKGLIVNLEDTLESAEEATFEKLELVLEASDVAQMDAEEPVPCVLVQEDLIEEMHAPVEVSLEDPVTEANAQSVVSEIVPADVPQMDAKEEPAPCVIVQEKLVEEIVAPAEVSLGDVVTGADASSVFAVIEPADMPQMDAKEEPEPCVFVQEDLVEEIPASVEVSLGDFLTEADASSVCAVVEPANMPQMDAREEPEPCVLVQKNLVEEIPAPVEVLLGDLLTEADASSVVAALKPSDVPQMDAKEVPEPCVLVQEDLVKEFIAPVEDAANVEPELSPEPEPESVTPDPSPEEEKAPEPETENSQPEEEPEESIPEENPVMNFFKTLVTPTKPTKKETATPAAAKDQPPEESQPDATTTVAQVSEPPAAPKGMSIPPPPPPEPPKMEIKAEPAAKPAKSSPKVEPKAAAKEPEPGKGKSAKDTLSKFFRPKVLLGVKASKGKGASSGAKASAKPGAGTIKNPEPTEEVDAQPVVEEKETPEEVAEIIVEVQETPVEVPEPVVEVKSENVVEPPETAEESAQPDVEEQIAADAEVPQPEIETEKADPSKAGTLEAAAKPEPPPPVQEEKKTASKSAFLSLFKPKAADPKKETPAPAAAADTAQTAKEEPKAAAKSSEAAVENKPASAAPPAGEDAAPVPKLEKRNSIHKFFKNLGQKRGSTDAGVQAEAAAAAEKAK